MLSADNVRRLAMSTALLGVNFSLTLFSFPAAENRGTLRETA